MSIKKLLLSLATVSLLLGCGGGGGGGESTTTVGTYDGKWRHKINDNYIEISNEKISFRECSINDGYPEIENYGINGNSLKISTISYELQISGDNLSIVNADSKAVLQEYVRAQLIPSACTGDAIEITFVSPLTTTEGTPTTFIVNFDYRLSSKDNGIINLAFNTSSVGAYTIVGDELIITEKETSSGSLTSIVSPVFYNAPDDFGLNIMISENPHPAPWTPLTSAFKKA